MTLSPETLSYIEANADADIGMLALAKAPSGVDKTFALNQIAGRRIARKKIPTWAAIGGVIYPPHLALEQCSSEATASYKVGIVRRLMPDGGSMADITGGFGVDFLFLARLFREAVYVERQESLCAIVESNAKCLGVAQTTVINADATECLSSMPCHTLLYIDPARRDIHGARTFGIADCAPDVSALRDTLLDKAEYVMVKLSPMLDWRKAAEDMGSGVGEVHIVSVGGECKELLLVMSRRFSGLERVFCANDGHVFSFSPNSHTPLPTAKPTAGLYLYEPNASVMKAGCFAEIANRYGVKAVSRDSHLFLSEQFIYDFPGRSFVIDCVTSLNKRELRRSIGSLRQANITVRNFPVTVTDLRKRLRLTDGGDTYIMATTTEEQKSHLLLICHKK